MQRSDMPEFYRSHQLILAPMAGVSDPAFRQLCCEQGASLAFTEMVSAKGLSYGSEKTASLLGLGPQEEAVGVQIFGHEPLTMADQAARIAEHMGTSVAIIDINMGCPVRKIVSKGDGAALMADPARAESIVREVAHSLEGSGIPLTVKFRRGYEMGAETAPEFAKRMEQAGAWAITVHGRYAQQMYRGHSSDDAIARVVSAVQVPVVGNGDVNSAMRADSLKRQTGCSALMIARAAEGNPWIFRQCAAALAGMPIPAAPTFEERLAMGKRHALLLQEIEGPRIVKMRKHAMWYLTGIPGASRARRLFNDCTTAADFCAVFDGVADYLQKRQDAAPSTRGASPLRTGTEKGE
ncbi:MAG: tRNA dihydrouridine synthase DusB [Eggerthellaceae bacterium]